MPYPTEMTLLQAISEVQAACGQLDDATANPLLVKEITAHINRAVRLLGRDCEWLAQDRSVSVAVASGQRFVEFPVDGYLGRISEIRWNDSSTTGYRIIPTAGIDSREILTPGLPLNYDVGSTIGVTASTIVSGGTGYVNPGFVITGGARDSQGSDPSFSFTVVGGVITKVILVKNGTGWTVAPTLTITDGSGSGANITLSLGAIQAMELWPAPGNSGTLEVLYRSQGYVLSNDTDILPFDSEAIIGRAAILLAVAKAMPIASALGTMHELYMQKARTQQRPGETVSLSGWRRDGWDPRQVLSQ